MEREREERVIMGWPLLSLMFLAPTSGFFPCIFFSVSKFSGFSSHPLSSVSAPNWGIYPRMPAFSVEQSEEKRRERGKSQDLCSFPAFEHLSMKREGFWTKNLLTACEDRLLTSSFVSSPFSYHLLFFTPHLRRLQLSCHLQQPHHHHRNHHHNHHQPFKSSSST